MKAESLMARYGENWDSKTKCTVMIAMAVSERKVGFLTLKHGIYNSYYIKHTFRMANLIRQWLDVKRQ